MRAQADIYDDSDSDGKPFSGMIVYDGTRETLPGDFLIPTPVANASLSSKRAPTVSQRHNTYDEPAPSENQTARSIPKLILRFYFSLSSDISSSLNSWVATTKSEENTRDLFNLTDTLPWSVATREALVVTCTPLTRGQRCADWLVLRQF